MIRIAERGLCTSVGTDFAAEKRPSKSGFGAVKKVEEKGSFCIILEA